MMKKIIVLSLACLSLLLSSNGALASGSVSIRLDSPRATMQTFMEAMQEYKEGKLQGNRAKESRIEDAILALDLSNIPDFLQDSQGRSAAIFLKETIDRVIQIDYSKIPSNSKVEKQTISRWRLKGTEIVIRENDKGKFLFSPRTVSRAYEFYTKVKNQPFIETTGKGALYTEPFLERVVPQWGHEKNFLIPNWKWVALVIIILLGFIVKWIGEKFFHIFKRITDKSKYKWDDALVEALEPPFGLLAACGFWYFSVIYLQFSGRFEIVVSVVLELIASVAIIWAFYRLSGVVVVYLKGITRTTEDLLDDQVLPLIQRTLRIFVIIFGVLVVLQSLGINVVSLLAGLGIGGLALALAGKDLAANLFGFMTIIFDRPFRVGDWILIKGNEGTVESIGFRSTRLRTFYNSVITVPNAAVTDSEVDNMGSRMKRRLKAVLGVTYDTTPEKIEEFVEGVKKVIQSNQYTEKTDFHVVVQGYGASAIEVLLYCFVVVPDWSTELKEKQNIYLEILKLSKQIGVEFAFPTQTIHLESLPKDSKGFA